MSRTEGITVEFEYLKPLESPEPEDQIAQAVEAIHEAVKVIEGHYHDAGGWPACDEEARISARLGYRLLRVSIGTALDDAEHVTNG